MPTILQDIQTGLKAHGIVNGFTSYGMFVHFYGDIRGLVHISEMDLEPGAQPSEAFKIGQVGPLTSIHPPGTGFGDARHEVGRP